MRRLHPSYLMLIESDIWYHLLSEAKKQGAPSSWSTEKSPSAPHEDFRRSLFFPNASFLSSILFVRKTNSTATDFTP